MLCVLCLNEAITLNLFFYKYWSSLEATWIEMFLNERHVSYPIVRSYH